MEPKSEQSNAERFRPSFIFPSTIYYWMRSIKSSVLAQSWPRSTTCRDGGNTPTSSAISTKATEKFSGSSTPPQRTGKNVNRNKKRFTRLIAPTWRWRKAVWAAPNRPANQDALKAHLDCVVLPKKGRRSQADKARKSEPQFIHLRRQHSAVESAINALEIHGLDTCPDHGIDGFKRYVALAVVGRNIQRLGAVLRQQEREKEQRKRGPYKKRAA